MKYLQFLQDLGLIRYLLVALGISINAIGHVYIWGTLTGFVTYWRHKSNIGILMMLFATTFYMFSHEFFKCPKWIIAYYGMTMFHLAIVLYTVFFIKLRERTDTFLDRRVGKDRGEAYRKMDKRSKKRKRR